MLGHLPTEVPDSHTQIKSCGLCSSDIDILRAPIIPPYLFLLVAGHEGVGYRG